MSTAKIQKLPLLPEGLLTATPTISHIFDRFEHVSRCHLFDGKRLVKSFAKPLSHEQTPIFQLLVIAVRSPVISTTRSNNQIIIKKFGCAESAECRLHSPLKVQKVRSF